MNLRLGLDEGFSEDTRSQSDGDAMRVDPPPREVEEPAQSQVELPDWVRSLSEVQRSEFAYAILRSLRTSSIAAIVERLTPFLHLDFVRYLPAELTLEILSYLDAQTLLLTSQVSKAWRERALDSRLWMHLFSREGWSSNIREVRGFREAAALPAGQPRDKVSRPRRVRSRDDDALHAQKKRIREGGLFGEGSVESANTARNTTVDAGGPESWADQHGIVEADEGPIVDPDDQMQDVSFQSPPVSGISASLSTLGSHDLLKNNVNIGGTSSVPVQLPIRSSLYMKLPNQDVRLNWQHLFKQKRRLEENWAIGKFKNFQLPHPKHPEEAHAECVYTIQYSGKYLVSGSRDKTLRIWDLETQRLVRPALVGHRASVLCLQFDERPEEDIIISGGSDCTVILWKFSTGEIIQKLHEAHSESVLNLRFDERYLVTCSKDKTIKVWNRKSLLPTDDAYPSSTQIGGANAKFPSYIINMQDAIETDYLHRSPVPPYSVLMTLHGHTAAVNAIQIFNDEIVSASGDRSIKLWNIRSGECIRTFTGHSKGIACVQYDGRRIVSGSSDETVRIFDRETAAEVACLRGHSVLVRTVQANFGDQPGNEAELAAEAKAVDDNYFKALSRGEIPMELTREQRRARNAGSRDPKDLFAHGAKIPPGGGGTRWGRIVSGSYDETVIIWKRDEKGRWVARHRLQQADAVNAAGGLPRPTPPGQPRRQQQATLPVLHQALSNAASQSQSTQTQPGAEGLATQPPNTTGSGGAPRSQSAGPSTSHATPPRSSSAGSLPRLAPRLPSSQLSMVVNANSSASGASAAPNAMDASSSSSSSQHQAQPGSFLPGFSSPRSRAAQLSASQQRQQQRQQQQMNNLQDQLNNPQNASSSVNTLTPSTGPTPSQTITNAPPLNHNAQPPHHHHGHHHHHHHHHAANAPAIHSAPAGAVAAGAPAHPHHAQHPQSVGMNSRVFKLQFDARRIICCSQEPVIVGWDFAAGDRQIEEASRFFGEDG